MFIDSRQKLNKCLLYVHWYLVTNLLHSGEAELRKQLWENEKKKQL